MLRQRRRHQQVAQRLQRHEQSFRHLAFGSGEVASGTRSARTPGVPPREAAAVLRCSAQQGLW